MNYQTYDPHPELASLISCYWTLEVPANKEAEKQRIVPDGCLEMAFILADDIKRFTNDDDYILQPRAMVLGQTLEPFYIQPVGEVNTFAVRFYPYGFANFVSTPIKALANKETPIDELFAPELAKQLEQDIIHAKDAKERIAIVEQFLLGILSSQPTLDHIVKSTVDALWASKGGAAISSIVEEEGASRRQLERKFASQIGISPKQLGKVIRLQAALKMLLSQEADSLSQVAYQSDYYDQAHFIKDFKELTGISPKEFLGSESMELSSLFYS